MAKNSLEKYSHKAELQQVLGIFDDIEEQFPALTKAIAPTRRLIGMKIHPNTPRITASEQRDIMLEVNLILQAGDDMVAFEGNKNVQRLIVRKVNDIHPTFD